MVWFREPSKDDRMPNKPNWAETHLCLHKWVSVREWDNKTGYLAWNECLIHQLIYQNTQANEQAFLDVI